MSDDDFFGVITMRLLPLLVFLIVGCAQSSSLLMPSAEGERSSASDVIEVVVKPVTTHGIGSDDEKRWGLDISAYFSAFEVDLANRTKEDISFFPLQTSLSGLWKIKKMALGEDDSIHYYKGGDAPVFNVLIPKSKRRIKKEVEQIKKARLLGGTLKPGEEKTGLILFKKVYQDRCKRVVLAFEGITVVRTGEKKTFSFEFSCEKEE